MSKRTLALLLSALLCMALVSCGGESQQTAELSANDATQEQSANNEEDAAPQTVETETDDVPADENKVALSDLADAFAGALLSGNHPYSHVDVEVTDDTVTLTAQRDGISRVVDAIKNGTYDAEKWDTVRNAIPKVTDSMLEALDAAGYSDVHLVFNLVNEQNPEEIFVTFYDSELTYDVIE